MEHCGFCEWAAAVSADFANGLLRICSWTVVSVRLFVTRHGFCSRTAVMFCVLGLLWGAPGSIEPLGHCRLDSWPADTAFGLPWISNLCDFFVKDLLSHVLCCICVPNGFGRA